MMDSFVELGIDAKVVNAVDGRLVNPLALSGLNLPFFKWMVNEKKLSLLFEKFHEIENNVLMHREGWKG